MERQVLHGGREGKIRRERDTVVRPANAWTPYVHAFLRFLLENGMDGVPRPCGIREDGCELVSYVEGEVYPGRLPDSLYSDSVLADAAALLRRYHDAGAAYIQRLTGEEVWMLPARSPSEVMCHGDFAPYNVTFRGGRVYGLIDFDTLHPGPRLWDLAYAAYRWVPLMAPSNPEHRARLEEQLRRLRLFADVYGLDAAERPRLPGCMAERLDSLIRFMEKEAEAGNGDMQKNLAEGHVELYRRDMAYIREHEEQIVGALLSGGGINR